MWLKFSNFAKIQIGYNSIYTINTGTVLKKAFSNIFFDFCDKQKSRSS